VRVLVTADREGEGLLQAVAEDGAPAGPVRRVRDVAAAVGEWERAEQPRWVWAATGETYQPLLRAGLRVARCHDLALTEGVLLAHEGRWGEPHSFAAALARLRGLPVPEDRWRAPHEDQLALFEPDRSDLPEGDGLLAAVLAVHAEQQRRLAAAEQPDRYLVDIIKHGGAPFGRPGMPAFGAQLSDDDIASLVAYVRSLATAGGGASPRRPG